MPSSSSSELQNPNNGCNGWRFTWETQSHIPTLRLFLFNPNNLNLHLSCLKAEHIVEQFTLAVSFSEAEAEIILRVPVPRVLIDSDSPIQCRALNDHIEVKLVLLLPIDHPLVSDFDSLLNLAEPITSVSNELRPLFMDFDVKKLSALKEVHFYCRHCSTKLTKALSCFEEMLSVNWRDVADSWFGACCCSFGGISEKMVKKYAESYKFSPGLCHLSTTSVILCKDDLIGCEFSSEIVSNSPESEVQSTYDTCATEAALAVGSEQGKVEDKVETSPKINTNCCTHETTEPNSDKVESEIELLENQKIFLNGYLGDGFMARSSGISKEIKWNELLCPQCSCLLGTYPCSSNDQTPLDGRVRLFKCYISTSLPTSGSNDLFRNYTLERMFTSELLESSKEELSFRTIVKNIETNNPMINILLINPNSWCYTGNCLPIKIKQNVTINMHPSVKVLFSACNYNADLESRKVANWGEKSQCDEVYMLPAQVKELISKLELTNNIYPSSHTFQQGFLLSSMKR